MNIFNEFNSVAYYGVTDFKDECADLLKTAMDSGQDFTAEWSCTKELSSAKVVRVNGKVTIQVCTEIDALESIIGSTIAEYAESQFTEDMLEQWQEACDGVFTEHFCESVLGFDGDYDHLIEDLKRLERNVHSDAQQCYSMIVNYLRGEIELLSK